jgi:hypothetical protein
LVRRGLNEIAPPRQLNRSVAFMSEFEGNEKCLSRIVGEGLTAVNFVLDYLVFQFNDCFLTVLTTIRVRNSDGIFSRRVILRIETRYVKGSLIL